MLAKKLSMSLIIVVVFLFVGQSALADRTYTSDDDFAEGNLVDVNYDTPDQLQLNYTAAPFAFVNVAATGRGTIVRIDAESGDILGEYRTAPEGYDASPSRTSVDPDGNVWTANLEEAGLINGIPHGSVVKIGLVVGGTRVRKETNDEDETILVPDPSGEYLQGPFPINTCDDRDHDGLIRTSPFRADSDWPAVLDWNDSGRETEDGLGGTDGSLVGNVENAEDECILLYQRLADAEEAHHVSVDPNDFDNVWVGGFPGGTRGDPKMFYKLNAGTAAVEAFFDARDYGCGGFGGLVDSNGVLWSASLKQGLLLHYNTDTGEAGCTPVALSYGLGIDSLGFIWNSSWLNSDISGTEISKVDPDTFTVLPGFPKLTAPDRQNQGVAITPDNNVWVAQGFGREVLRLDNSGGILKEIRLEQVLPDGDILDGDNPTGVAADANGKVWVTNLDSDNIMRIDPNGGTDGLGAVDLTIELDWGAPDNYSGMTGVVDIVSTAPEGTWTVVHDGGDSDAGAIWDTITCNAEEQGSVPEGEGAFITVDARASDTAPVVDADGNSQLNGDYTTVLINCEPPQQPDPSPTGRYIQIRVTMTPNDEGESPILSDLTVKSVEPEPEGLVCDVNHDEFIDIYDILGIFFTIGDSAEEGDRRDWDEDGTITIIDARGCVLECNNDYCAPKKTVLSP